MSEFEKMREKHRKDSMRSLAFFFFIFLIYLFDDYLISLFKEVLKDPEKLWASGNQAWLKFFGAVVATLLVPFVTYFVGIVTIAKRDFYYVIDNVFFKRRIKVDRFICMKMIAFKKHLGDEVESKLAEVRSAIDRNESPELLMELFYKYIEKEEIVNPALKSQAFAYWGDYFSNITFIFLGVCFLLLMLVIGIISGAFSFLQLILICLILILLILNFYSIHSGKTAKKLFEIPETQINQIHSKGDDELLNDLKARNFGMNL